MLKKILFCSIYENLVQYARLGDWYKVTDIWLEVPKTQQNNWNLLSSQLYINLNCDWNLCIILWVQNKTSFINNIIFKLFIKRMRSRFWIEDFVDRVSVCNSITLEPLIEFLWNFLGRWISVNFSFIFFVNRKEPNR